MKRFVFILIVVLNINNVACFARDSCKIWKPDYLKIQYAGNMGLVSFGAGKTLLKDRISIDINYGYLPKSINGVCVHTFGLKPAFHFRERMITKSIVTQCYSGISINYAVARHTYVVLPGRFPDGYYKINAIRLYPFIGLRSNIPVRGRMFRNCYLYTEAGTIDYMLRYALTNKEIKMSDIWNFCYGLALKLN